MTRKPTAREKILSATEDLLASEGLLAVNTNRVADEAGVNISTLYKHFGNKVEILVELLRGFESSRTSHIAGWDGKISSRSDWERWARETVDSMVLFRREKPAAQQLRAAIKVHPELARVDADSTAAAVESVIEHLPPAKDDRARKALSAFLHLASQTMSMVLDEVDPDDEESRLRIDALTDFLCGGYETVERLTTPISNR